MKLSEYLSRQPHGAMSRLAESIKAHAPDVSMWSSGKKSVPVNRCVQIEAETRGLVRRQDLRPDDWHLIWPELVEASAAACEPADSEVTTSSEVHP
jgi:DNA-binding transcriptional regulator YdaS (Cro superfamily)